MAIPYYYDLFNPLLRALHKLGGSGANSEIADEVARALRLSEKDLATLAENKTYTKFEYRLAWARSYLKKVGLVTNSERGVWALTQEGRTTTDVDPQRVLREVRSQFKRKPGVKRQEGESEPGNNDEERWREDLLGLLLKLDPAHFERVCQRILRESGFVQVEVTGRSGDGGIDGTGVVRIGGLLTFPVIFQCKRHQGSVGSKTVRDFRGAMVGRADRGLILTTGLFSRDARAEASRDGAPPIDLVDRERLLDKLKELKLGIKVTMVEQVEITPEWYESI